MKNSSFILKVFLSITFLLASNVYVFTQENNYIKTGMASFYADKFEGKTTANGEIYYHAKKTAAHKTLPFGSIVKVTNPENNKFVVVRINDRGPFVDSRIIDLSKSAAEELNIVGKGLAKVEIELIASMDDLPDNITENLQDNKPGWYFKLDIESVSPKGKGVQIGSFKEDENVFRLAERLKTKYNTDVYIEVATINDQKLYRVILGNSEHEEYLEKLKKTLSTEYPDCFIVQFK